MVLVSLLSVLHTLVLAAMATILRRDWCDTNITPERAAAMEQDFLERQKASAKLERHTLKVNFHVISEDDTEAGGNILESSILRQVDVLNEAYHDLGISWTLGNITRSVDAEWFNNVSKGSAQDIAMKKALHRGSAADLNVYTVKLTENVLGYATSPLGYSIDPLLDGVVLRSATVPENDFTSLLITTAQALSHYAAYWIGIYNSDQDIPSFNSTNWTPHFTFDQATKASELLKSYRVQH